MTTVAPGEPGYRRYREVKMGATGIKMPVWHELDDIERAAWDEAAFATEMAADARRDTLRVKLDAIKDADAKPQFTAGDVKRVFDWAVGGNPDAYITTGAWTLIGSVSPIAPDRGVMFSLQRRDYRTLITRRQFATCPTWEEIVASLT